METAAQAPTEPVRLTRDRLLINLKRKNIPGLDGIRGIAALCVVLFHGWSERFPARMGVQVFFVISGLLITWLLLAEEERSGQINRKAFYVRRAFRLFPALYLFLAWEWVTNYPPVGKRGLISAAFYYANYRGISGATDMSSIVQTWSLAVEEHFYLVWPQVLIWVRNRRRLMYWCFGLGVLEIAWRIASQPWLGSFYTAFATETNSTGILIGCGIALVLWFEPCRFPSVCLRPALGVVSVVALIALAQVPDEPQLRWAVPISTVFAAIVVLQAVTYEWRILQNPVALYLGRISYAVYLWGMVAKRVGRQFASGPVRQIVMVAAVIAIATISRYLVEKPAQRLAKRWLA